MRLLPLRLLAGLACLSSAAMAAQSGPSRPAESAAEDIRRVHDYARCVAQARPDWASELLALDPRDSAYGRLAGRLYRPDGRCWFRLGEAQRNRALRVQFSQRMFAGAMAEALLSAELAAGEALDRRVALDPARPALAARSEEEVMSLCTVRAAPGEVVAVLRTAPASPEEAAAIRTVTPHIASCLVAGATGEFNRPAIRSMLALAAWRLVRHNAAPVLR